MGAVPLAITLATLLMQNLPSIIELIAQIRTNYPVNNPQQPHVDEQYQQHVFLVYMQQYYYNLPDETKAAVSYEQWMTEVNKVFATAMLAHKGMTLPRLNFNYGT